MNGHNQGPPGSGYPQGPPQANPTQQFQGQQQQQQPQMGQQQQPMGQPGMPPQQSQGATVHQFPQGMPPQGQPDQMQGGAQPWEGTPGFDQLPPDARAAIEAEMAATQPTEFQNADLWNPPKPSAVGQTTEAVIRILPGWVPNQPHIFWYKDFRHFCVIKLEDGRQMRLPRSCPRENSNGARPCPICERQERAQAMGDTATSTTLKARPRFFANVIDAQNQQDHWVQDPQSGQSKAVAKVWGMSSSVYNKLGKIIGSRGPIYDMQMGRYIKVFTTKVGKEDRDVRYDAIDVSDVSPVPQGFENVELMALDQIETEKDYATLAREIAETYPDGGAPAAQQNYQQQGPAQTSNPPYGNPYQQGQQQFAQPQQQQFAPQQTHAPAQQPGYQQQQQQFQQPAQTHAPAQQPSYQPQNAPTGQQQFPQQTQPAQNVPQSAPQSFQGPSNQPQNQPPAGWGPAQNVPGQAPGAPQSVPQQQSQGQPQYQPSPGGPAPGAPMPHPSQGQPQGVPPQAYPGQDPQGGGENPPF